MTTVIEVRDQALEVKTYGQEEKLIALSRCH
jgi:hypothetical protein